MALPLTGCDKNLCEMYIVKLEIYVYGMKSPVLLPYVINTIYFLINGNEVKKIDQIEKYYKK